MSGWYRIGLLSVVTACSAAPTQDKAPHTDTDPGAVDSDVPVETDVTPLDPTLVDVDVATSGPVTCADPSARAERKWSEIVVGGPRPTDHLSMGLVGGGAAIADFDGDGHLDVFSPGLVEHRLSMRVAHHTYNNVFDTHMAGIDLSYATGASAVDFDGDGDMDLFVTRWDMPDRLLANDGTGHFTDVTRRSQIRGIHRTTTSSWGDMDMDGDLDLFVGTYGPHPDDAFAEENFTVGEPSHIWMNVGDGRFVERSEALPPDIQRAYVFMSSWVDLNGDMRPELLLVNDFGWARPSRIFWNTPEGLVPDDGAAQFDTYFAGMGLGIGDVNDDEVPDFAQSSWKEAALLVSTEGRPVWYDFALSRNLWPSFIPRPENGEPIDTGELAMSPRQVFGWGTEMADLDNDGDHDVVMLFGEWDQWPNPSRHRDGLFVQDDVGTFYDEAKAWGFDDTGVARGLVVVDLDDDGFLDVYKRRLNDRSPLYFSQCDDAAWLRVRLEAPGPNTKGVGARVRVVAGDARWNRWITAGGTSIFSGSPPEVHVGLGDLDRVDQVEIFWPDGKRSLLQDVDTRQLLTVTRKP